MASSPVILEAVAVDPNNTGTPTDVRVKWNDPAYGAAGQGTNFKIIHDDQDGSLPAWTSAIDAGTAGGGDGAGNYEVLVSSPLSGNVVTFHETFKEYPTGTQSSAMSKGGSVRWGGAWTGTTHQITNRTISSESDNRVILNASAPSFARLLEVGTSWNSIRIGVRYSIDGPTSTIAAPHEFNIGLCSGVANPFHPTNSTTHFLGMTRYHPTDSFGYFTSGGLATYHSTQYMSMSRIGSTTSRSSTLTASTASCIGRAATQRGCVFLTITKGSPNFTLRIDASGFAGDTGWRDRTLADFKTAMAATTISTTQFASTLTTTRAVDEATNGYLDAINLYWGDSTYNMEISDVDYRVIS